MSGSRFPSALQALIIVNAVTVIGLAISSHAAGVTPTVWILEALIVGAVAAATLWLVWKKDGAPAGSGSPADLEKLRRESHDNFTVLQKDLQHLGAAVIRRLDAAAENAPAEEADAEAFAAVNGAMTDLAVSLAEARETLAALAAELGEIKSVAFEMQAQLDQQADALRAFEHTVEKIHPDDVPDAGEGAAPGSLGKALAAGASGSAVARLIGNGFRPDAEFAPELPVPEPVATTDVESDYAEPDADIPAADFDAGDLVAEHADDLASVGETPAEAPVVGETPSEEDDDAGETDDWLSMGIEEDEDGRAVAAEQPALLDIGDDAEAPRKPRRPGKNDTALVAHVMIGIGNKPYLRGHGPGLSPDKGVPMEYVDVGRWQWIAPETGSPLAVTLWKNDEVPAEDGRVEVPAGMTLEIRPHFAG